MIANWSGTVMNSAGVKSARGTPQSITELFSTDELLEMLADEDAGLGTMKQELLKALVS
jgi:hypothetical protein